MTIFQLIDSFRGKGKYFSLHGRKATWGLFALFAGTLFLTVILSHWFFFHTIYISSLWKNPYFFFTFWLPKISVSLFFATFVLFTKRKWWTLVVLGVISFWLIANMLYYRANNVFLTWDGIALIGNLQGFESSIGFYWNNACTVYLIIPIVYGFCLQFIKRRDVVGGGRYVVLFILLCSHIIGAELYRRMMQEYTKIPWRLINNIPFFQEVNVRYSYYDFYPDYLFYHSIPTALPYTLTGVIGDRLHDVSVIITSEEEKRIQSFIRPKQDAISPAYNIIFILIESFESFALEVKDVYGNYVMPNLHRLTMQKNVLYADKLASQVRVGTSIDGQQICM